MINPSQIPTLRRRKRVALGLGILHNYYQRFGYMDYVVQSLSGPAHSLQRLETLAHLDGEIGGREKMNRRRIGLRAVCLSLPV